MSETPEKVNKTKLLLTLKTEITDVKQALDVEKGQLEKLQKRLAQSAMKEGFNGELAKLRDEVADESQILMKVVSWIRDKLDGKIDGKIETAHTAWTQETQELITETDAKVRKDLREIIEDDKSKSLARWDEYNQARKLEIDLLKEEFARSLADAKDQWQKERIELETQIQTLHKEQSEYQQTQYSSFVAENKLLVATEVDKAVMEKGLQVEEKLHIEQVTQGAKLREEFQKSSDDFRELLKMDLALLKNDERLLWEKERQAIREEERKFRESVRATIVEEITRFQSDALSIISQAQEELAKRKAKGFVEGETNGEAENNTNGDELFAIGRELSEKQSKREKEIQTQKIKIQPDNILRRFGDDEADLDRLQQQRDTNVSNLRSKEDAERQREEEEQRAREEEIKKEREKLENLRKQMEIDQKREKQEAAQREKEAELRREKERTEHLQKLEEERTEKLQQLKQQREEDLKKEKSRQEEAKRHREEEERKLEDLKRQNQTEREEREREFERAQQRREKEQAEREQEAALKQEEEKRKKHERKEAEERERQEKEREREEREEQARKDKEEQERLKKEKKERKFRERQEQEEREKEEREAEEQRQHEAEERAQRDLEAKEEEESRRHEEERKEKEKRKKEEKEKKIRERQEQERLDEEEREREREVEKDRRRKEREEEERKFREAEKEKDKKRKEKERKEKEAKETRDKEEREEREREEHRRREQEAKEKAEEDNEQRERQLLTNPSKAKRATRPPTSVTPKIATRDSTDTKANSSSDESDDEKAPSPSKAPQRAGSVSVLPVVPGKVTLKSAAQRTSEDKSAPTPAARKEEPRESASGECDVSDSEVQNAWQEVRSDTSNTNWFILGYGGSKTILSLYGKGSGGVKEFQQNLKNEILYGYIRIPYGDNNQAKFVFVTYFPENIPPIARARANPHKPIVDKFVKIYNIQIAATTPDEVAEDVIMAKLRAAGGANYGAQQKSASPAPVKETPKKDDEKQKKEAAEKQKKEDERKAKEEADRKKQDEERRKNEEAEERKKADDAKKKLKDKEDSFSAYVGVSKDKEANTANTSTIGAKNKCSVCSKTVYLTEQIMADNKAYHKTCFRCAHCNNIIKLGNFAALNGKLYCKPHFKQLFASKGNYNEGFGKAKLTHEWAANNKTGNNDSDDEEEKPVPVKSTPAPVKPAPAAAAAAAPKPSAPSAVTTQKKSDSISNSKEKEKEKEKAAPSATISKEKAALLKTALFDSDDDEDALFKK